MPTTNETTREARKSQLLHKWNRDRNSHLEVIRLYRRSTGSNEELGAGTNVIERLLDAEFGATEDPEAPAPAEDVSENAA